MPLYRQLQPLTLQQTDHRFGNAERRVGLCLYQTNCPTCSSCEGLRVVVNDFKPSKSQRRVRNRWKGHGRVEYAPVVTTHRKLAMFNRHKQQRNLAESQDSLMDIAGYANWLQLSCMFSVEMRYYFDEELVGVGIVDLGARAASSVYFYFDPKFSKLSPGVFSALHEIEFCRQTGREYLYLGLYVKGCKNLEYKADYYPHERLVDGDWRLHNKQSKTSS